MEWSVEPYETEGTEGYWREEIRDTAFVEGVEMSNE